MGNKTTVAAFLFLGVVSVWLWTVVWQSGPRYPVVHDEFVNILIADTLLHGRLANPPHPFASHFETIYVLQRPRYAGIYPIGTGALLAIGKLLTGEYHGGIAVGAVLILLSLFYAFSAFVPPLWAAVGASALAASVTLSTYWLSYWNGFVGLGGAALALGGLRRWVDNPKAFNGGVCAAGVTSAFFTRPFEAMILGAAIGVLAVLHTIRTATPFARVKSSILACSGVLIVGIVGTGLHNRATTGNPLVLPYLESMRVHGVPQPPILSKELPEPLGLSASQRFIYLWQRDLRRRYEPSFRTVRDRALTVINATYAAGGFKTNAILTVAALIMVRDYWTYALFAGSVAGLIAGLIYPYFLLHYYGPFLPLLLAVPLRGAYAISSLTLRWPTMRLLAAAGALGAIAFVVLYRSEPAPPKPDYGRNAVQAALNREGGRHLVFVAYSPGHDHQKEWIYNEADIDAAPVIWARTLGEAEDAALRQRFSERKVWLVTPGQTPLLQPLTAVSSVNGGSHPSARLRE